MREGGREKTILIVDDDEAQICILHKRFGREGFDILVARDGVEGLEIALRRHPDLMLLDILMPRMDGISMLRRLREDAWGKNAIVVILTNLADPEKEAEACSCAAADYLIKTDWHIDALVRRVEAYLGDR